MGTMSAFAMGWLGDFDLGRVLKKITLWFPVCEPLRIRALQMGPSHAVVRGNKVENLAHNKTYVSGQGHQGLQQPLCPARLPLRPRTDSLTLTLRFVEWMLDVESTT